jgi:DnaJ family protein B protein 6
MQAEIEGFMESIDRDPFGMGHIPRFTPRTRISTFPSVDMFSNEDGGGRWVSDSFMSTTINGVTQTIRKQKDLNVSIHTFSQLYIALLDLNILIIQGNEHITRTLPDGRKVRTINGVEQPRGHTTFSDNKNLTFPQSSENRYLPQPIASSSRMDYGSPSSYVGPPPSYHDNGNNCKSSTKITFLLVLLQLHCLIDFGSHDRGRRNSEKCMYLRDLFSYN